MTAFTDAQLRAMSAAQQAWAGDGEGRDGHDLEHLLGAVGEAIVYVDRDIRVRYCNQVYLAGLGLTIEQVYGRTPYEYFPNFAQSVFHEMLQRCHFERQPQASIGHSPVVHRWLMIRALPLADGGSLIVASDATDSLVKQYELAQQALKDPLTGLANKTALLQDTDELLREGRPFTLAILGLHRFKTVNHSVGFRKGDSVLQEIAARLRLAVDEPAERVYHLNGDEFALMLHGAASEVQARVKEINAQTLLPVSIGHQTFVLGAGIGMVEAPRYGEDYDMLVRRAALALRESKRVNATDPVIYAEALDRSINTRLALEAEFRRALEESQFVLMLQPKGCAQEDHVLGAEALIRWRHPQKGVVSPGEFLPMAEECGLMRTVDEWVLREAMKHARTLKQQGFDIPIAVNLSVDSLSDRDLVAKIDRILSESKVDASALEVEIPEGALMHDVEVSTRLLGGLHDLGVKISIDDFGTGYSSFAYLARFPVNTLKIDRSFVHDMTRNPTSRTIVRALIHLAHSLSLRVVAEGAEEEREISMLRKMRCDEIQGYGYARPMPFEDFLAFLPTRPRRGGPSAYTL